MLRAGGQRCGGALQVFETAFYTWENILLCAPTGAGKTNVGMLCILQQLARARRPDGTFDLASFKVIYISPMKV